MADQRIKGQEVSLFLILNNVPQQSISDIRQFEVTPRFDRLQEAYLGEVADRFDEIFRGARGSMELHYETPAVFDVVQAVLNRAQRRTPGTVINIKATLAFPNGQKTRILTQNVFFGDIPINFGSRSDYGSIKLEFEADNWQRV